MNRLFDFWQWTITLIFALWLRYFSPLTLKYFIHKKLEKRRQNINSSTNNNDGLLFFLWIDKCETSWQWRDLLLFSMTTKATLDESNDGDKTSSLNCIKSHSSWLSTQLVSRRDRKKRLKKNCSVFSTHLRHISVNKKYDKSPGNETKYFIHFNLDFMIIRRNHKFLNDAFFPRRS